MRTILKSLLLGALMVFCSSCNDEYPDNCAGYSANIYTGGYSHATGSYEDFGDNAIFVRDRMADTINGGWIHDPVEKGILLTYITEFCVEKILFNFSNIILVPNDTVFLRYSELGLSGDYPTSSMRYIDGDVSYETYHLVEGGDNWLIIDEINSDTTEIEGRFNVSYVTSYEPYLTGERQRWDDPNRPDTLHFSNGEFRAEFAYF